MVYCPNCDYWNNDNNKFCGNCGTRLGESKNYCPYCDRTFSGGENFCTECGTKLIAKSEHVIRSPPVRGKPADINSYKVNVDKKTRIDTVSITHESPTAEFEGKSYEELESELEFVTRRYEDCRKNGDYMANYYKEKKEILERLVGYNPF